MEQPFVSEDTTTVYVALVRDVSGRDTGMAGSNFVIPAAKLGTGRTINAAAKLAKMARNSS